MFNKKADFKAKVIAKTNEQRQRIINKVTHSFLFDSLEDKDLNTVIDAMEERKYNKGDNVITQGENGDVLYLVEQGTLDCFKTFVKFFDYRLLVLVRAFSKLIILVKHLENLLSYIMPREQLQLEPRMNVYYGLLIEKHLIILLRMLR